MEPTETPTEVSDLPDPENNEELKSVRSVDEKSVFSDVQFVEEVTQNGESFLSRRARGMANRPCLYLISGLSVSIAISAIGMVVGGFEVAVDNAGFFSRGTLIADRQMQFTLADLNRKELFNDETGEVWDDMTTNVQKGVSARAEAEEEVQRRLAQDYHYGQTIRRGPNRGPSREMIRNLQESRFNGTLLDGCDVNWYTNSSVLAKESRLWPVWKTKTASILEPESIRELCMAEQTTLAALESMNLCFGCDGEANKCLQPFSLVSWARLHVENGFSLNCEELQEEWRKRYDNAIIDKLQDCSRSLKAGTQEQEDLCFGFEAFMFDSSFESTESIQFSSSVFPTKEMDVERLYDNEAAYDRGGGVVEGAYDTQNEDFVALLRDESVGSDMMLALGSAVITFVAIVVHTRSIFISLVGLLQIVLSFPVAFFVYTFVARLEFFPFLNFIGVFVVFALGADDIFVAIDKWKNSRLFLGQEATTQEVAVRALPDAALSMFLTTTTTAVAFFGTAVCPVAPIRCFAVFCGLLIAFDYVLCVFLVFPALCIYDQRLGERSSFWRFQCRCTLMKGCTDSLRNSESATDKQPSLIRVVLSSFYDGFHKIRWFLLVVCAVAAGVSGWYASDIPLPKNGDVRVLQDDIEYEISYQWRQNLLSQALARESGGSAFVVFGSTAADFGDHNNPAKFSRLVLEERFEPSNEEAQVFLKHFCIEMFESGWAENPSDHPTCNMIAFDSWLQEQAAESFPSSIWTRHCAGAGEVPVPEVAFDSCIEAWSKDENVREDTVLVREGKVKIIHIPFQSRVLLDSSFSELDAEWNLIETWMEERRSRAPEGMGKFFHTSSAFWWYDTNKRLLDAAFTSAAIAISTGALVILLSSRSLTLTIFSAATIGFVLASVTASLVSMGWTLGFLESICFAILIVSCISNSIESWVSDFLQGISCDFVIHFSHAYASLPGDQHRSVRTKHALIEMGPSILAAAFTTIAAATIMLFTVISFFTRFAEVLFLTIVLATGGSFVFFLTVTDCVGPSQPTAFVDKLSGKCSRAQP